MGKHVVIIGNGISGVTTARHLRKTSSDTKITIISSETDHFFSRTALMYIFMGHMKYEHTKPYENHFWKKNRIDLLKAHVKEIDFNKKTLQFSDGKTLVYDDLVLALGSKPAKFGWPGQDLPGVQGLYHYQDLELLEKNVQNAKHAIIVGGGLIGVELAEMLLTRNIKVTFLVREDKFWGSVLPAEDAKFIGNHIINDHHVDIKFHSNLREIQAGDDGRVRSVVIDETGEEVPCEIVGLTPGVQTNVDFLRNTELEIDRGILINEFMETNIPNVYSLGDCAQHRKPPVNRRPVEQVWYTGKMMGESLGKTLGGQKTAYNPGHWFNSAKFFDIEYQTYGMVLSNSKDDENTFFWQHPIENIALRLVFKKESFEFVGTNVYGIRLRHELFDKWLNEHKNVQHVLEHFNDANFDPEFYKNHSKSILAAFNQQFGTNIKAKKKSWKRIFNLQAS
jgi:NAD(P)H-nitrite reductase large subunit